ncbi:MAG: hypothetical protein AAGE52_07250 [Myxococcota bacterium]
MTSSRPALVGVALLFGCIVSNTAHAHPPLRWATEAHFSLLSNQADRSLLNVTFGGGFRFGYRGDGEWGGFLHFEQNAWLATELFRRVVPGVWNIALGVERLWASKLIRTAMAAGVSILAYDTELHRRGTTGVFFDLRPASLRWQVSRIVAVELTPLHFVVVAPVLREPELVNVEYRTTLGVEVTLQ